MFSPRRLGLSCGVPLIAALLCIMMPFGAQAAGPTPQAARCADLAGLFQSPAGADYRPMITLGPARTRGSQLDLDIEARTGTSDGRPIRIGSYLATGAPAWIVAPQAGKPASGYVYDPQTGHPCPVTRAMLRSPAFQQDWLYGGVRLELRQRDRLVTHVTSALSYAPPATADPTRPKAAANGGVPCQATNQHTHGLLVRPRNRDGSRGDYVFDLALPDPAAVADACADPPQPASAHAHGQMVKRLDHRIDIPRKPPTPEQALGSGYHPSGLFWFHPHGHGYSGHQVRGATTGLITVGRLSDTIEVPLVDGRQRNLRHLMLKDAQLLAAEPASGARPFNAKYDGAFCGDAVDEASAIFAQGECAGVGDFQNGVWVFTINGVQYPRIAKDVTAADIEVWRIANASANVSYRLVLYPKGTGGIERDPTKRKPFQIAGVDGVTVSGTDPSGRITATELFMMPGSRATIILSPEPGRTFALVTETVLTGGDTWPPVALAEVSWPGRAAPVAVSPPAALSAAAAAPSVATRGPATVNALAKPGALATASQPRDICDLPEGRERLILFVKRLITDGAPEVFGLVAGTRPAGITDLSQAAYFRKRMMTGHGGGHAAGHGPGHAGHAPPTGAAADALDPADYERMSWTELAALFATVVDRTQPGASLSPAYGQAPLLAQVCARLGRTETWVIENWTDEIHNFHIHQSQFAISDDPDRSRFDAPYPYADETAARPWDTLCATRTKDDPFNGTDCAIASRYLSALRANHDSVPIPRGRALSGDGCTGVPGAETCRPGRISITIAFNRQEQLGRFVFHCHILEHEDLGMMGEIVVQR